MVLSEMAHWKCRASVEYPRTIAYPAVNPFKNQSENKTQYSYSMRCKLVAGYSAFKLKVMSVKGYCFTEVLS